MVVTNRHLVDRTCDLHVRVAIPAQDGEPRYLYVPTDVASYPSIDAIVAHLSALPAFQGIAPVTLRREAECRAIWRWHLSTGIDLALMRIEDDRLKDLLDLERPRFAAPPNNGLIRVMGYTQTKIRIG